MTLKFDGWPWKTILCQAWCIISKFAVNSNLSYSPETLNSGQNRWFFVRCVLEIWRMTLKNNRASVLCCFKLCASFHSHQWIQTRVVVRKRPIWSKSRIFLFCVTFKFNGWPWKTIGHLFYATSSFVHHFTCQSHRWIQTWVTVQKHSIQVKIGDFLSHVTLKFGRWP